MTMINCILILFIFLFTKHFLIDFLFQTETEIKHKGILFDWKGATHSFKHGIATGLIFCIVVDPAIAVFLGILDLNIHYFVDFIKMRYGNKDISNSVFWNQLGLDQYCHYLTYILLVILALHLTIRY